MPPGLTICPLEESDRRRRTASQFNSATLQRRRVLLSRYVLPVAIIGLLLPAPWVGDFTAGSSTSALLAGGGGGSNPVAAYHREASLQDAFLSENQRAPSSSLPDNSSRWPAVVATVPVGYYPVGATYDAATGQVFITNTGPHPGMDFTSSNVTVINDTTDKVVASVAVGIEPWAATYDAATGQVFVTNIGSGDVSVISDTTDTVVATVPVGSYPWAITYDAAAGQVFVANAASNNVSVISDATDTVVTTIPIDFGPTGVAYDAATGQVFVTVSGSNSVSVISGTTDKVVATVPVGYDPWGTVYDATKGEVFVTNVDSNNVSVISGATDTVVATIPVGSDPGWAAYDRAKGDVFVTNCGEVCWTGGSGSGNVSVINDTTDKVVSWIQVGSYPSGVAYDAATGQVFVANYGSADVSVISFTPPAYTVTFTSNPTSCGSITFNGIAYSDGQSVAVPEGIYTISAASCTGYTLQSVAGTGSVSVSLGKATVDGVGGIVATFGSSAGLLGLPGIDGYYVLGGTSAAVLAVAIVTILVRSRRSNRRVGTRPNNISPSAARGRSRAARTRA
jgi:YVTN family beta-propeller protein